MKKQIAAFTLAAFLCSSCALGTPRTAENPMGAGMNVAGTDLGPGMCTAAFAVLGSLVGGLMAGFLAGSQTSNNTQTIQFGTIGTLGGAALLGLAGGYLCGGSIVPPAPAPSPTHA